MTARVKKLIIFDAVVLIAALFFTFSPVNPNTWLIKPLLADKETIPADIGVVLGGGLKLDGSLSNVAQERVDYAVSLHQTSGLPLLFSGGETPTGIEAVEMNRYAKTIGYAGLDHIEASSHSTYENAQFTAKLLDEGRFPDSTIQLITSPYHSRRALATFRKVMTNRRVHVTYPEATAALTNTIRGRWRGLYVLAREYAANVWYLIFYRVSTDMQPTQFVKGERLDFRMEDGLRLQADYYSGVTNKAVLLLHSYRRDRHAWNGVIETLQAKGWHVLAVDLRGHGESGGDYEQFTAADFNAIPVDALSLVAWLKQAHGPVDVTIVGASIGANAALRAASLADDVAAVVAVSPGADYHGLRTTDAVRNVRVPVLYVTAKDDEQSAGAFPALFNATGTPAASKELVTYDNGGHGHDLLAAQGDLVNRIIQFIDAL